jgi:hypothetical protein
MLLYCLMIAGFVQEYSVVHLAFACASHRLLVLHLVGLNEIHMFSSNSLVNFLF